MKKIWVLWGMWPQASLDFYDMLIQNTLTSSHEVKNQDFPYIILSNIPVPDLIQWKKDMDKTISMVNIEAKNLEKVGASFLVMPCNTMHLFQKEVLHWVGIPFISMIESVVEKVLQSGFKTVWLIGSTTTMQSGLYTEKLTEIWVTTLVPNINEHHLISTIIKKCIWGTLSIQDITIIENYCKELTKRWAEGIILWCTELPIIIKDMSTNFTFFLSSKILAEKCLLHYRWL